MDHVLTIEDVERQEKGWGGEFVLLKRTDNRVGVCGGFGIGSPIAAAIVEELIALGTKEFINIGTAGGLQKTNRIGDVVVCTEAIRDEGVSHHYLAPAPRVRPSSPLTDRLKGALTRAALTFDDGPTWTIDTPYRETVEEARHYQSQGVRTVEMEAAAVFAVAAYRRVSAAAAFVISDSLAELVWDPQFASPAVAGNLERLYATAVDALSAPSAAA
jgi:uridine phosphorylase